MHIVGKDFLQSCLAEEGYFLKLILNEYAAHFFPHTTEHSDATLPGLRYQHESQGNAVAATIKPAQINIRRHVAISAELMKSIVERLETEIVPTSPECPVPLTKLQEKPLQSPLPAKLGEVGASAASSGRGYDFGFEPRVCYSAYAPSRMSLKAPFDLPQLRWERCK